MGNAAYNADCLPEMKKTPDKYYDLAIVDPPYGAGFTEGGGCKGWFNKYNQKVSKGAEKNIEWDTAPSNEYFDELFRISRNQIIWGGNYFSLPPTRCFLIWRKKTISETFTMAMCEYAWTSFNSNAKVFECVPSGTKSNPRIHPTQKPVELYEWILKNYAHEGEKILDTHLGSGSSRIAAYNLGFDFTGYEIDSEYFRLQEERFKKHTSQLRLF